MSKHIPIIIEIIERINITPALGTGINDGIGNTFINIILLLSI